MEVLVQVVVALRTHWRPTAVLGGDLGHQSTCLHSSVAELSVYNGLKNRFFTVLLVELDGASNSPEWWVPKIGFGRQPWPPRPQRRSVNEDQLFGHRPSQSIQRRCSLAASDVKEGFSFSLNPRSIIF